MTLDPVWIASLAGRAQRPPARPRVPLAWDGIVIGSVETALLQDLQVPGLARDAHDDGFCLHGDLTPVLALVAAALHSAGRVPAWRNEQLAVRDAAGTVLGSVERGVTRLLGIATHAVHLLGVNAAGAHWLQLRSLAKPDDPGLWDTLVGGMVPAGETAEGALARETGEEAGLDLAQLADVTHGGTVVTRRPSGSVPHGYIVERLDWYRCVVPEGVVPVNRDGEVAEFRCMPPADVAERLQREAFTLDAALMLVARGL